MSIQKLSKGLRQDTEPLWRAIFAHPFVKNIGAGTLDRNRYEFYLKQDYLYLIEFSRVFALAAAKARGLTDMGYFATLLNATLNMEMDLHRKTCHDFGVSAEALEQTQPAMTTLAYTNFLVKTCYEGDITEILAALLPCASGYVEIAQRLKEQGLPEVGHLRNWIITYASNEFAEYADWLKKRLDHFCAGAAESARARYFQLYQTSSRFELLFFDMAWRMEIWPTVIPV